MGKIRTWWFPFLRAGVLRYLLTLSVGNLLPWRLCSQMDRGDPKYRPLWPGLHLLLIALAFVTTLVAGTRARAVTLEVGEVTVSGPGEMATLCVTMDSGGEQVAGTQNDLVWDGACATLTEDSCQASSHHGKTLHGNFPPTTDFTYRALLFSLTDTDPIPDGELYCCVFGVEVMNPGACCPVNIDGVGSSDPNGVALATTGVSGRLCLASDSPDTTTGSGGGGCSIAKRAEAGAHSIMWLVLPVILLGTWCRLRRGQARWSARHPGGFHPVHDAEPR